MDTFYLNDEEDLGEDNADKLKSLENIKKLAEWIRMSHFTVVLTGAGISTESGVPDFRSSTGWWQKIDPMKTASIAALKEEYDLFYEFYSRRIKELKNIVPNKGHRILSKWERQGFIYSIATQNVDGLHQKAGSKNVYELHGSINNVRCSECGKPYDVNSFLEKRICSECSGKLRPCVVLFGENLPSSEWDKATSDILKSELLIVIGTSLQVYPVNILPQVAKGRVVYINDHISKENVFDITIKGKAGAVLELIDKCISET